MDSDRALILHLEEVEAIDEHLLGGKTAKTTQMLRAGFRVPNGYCLTTEAYRSFLDSSGLKEVISRELERKAFSQMRWEEIWDTALRIRSGFLRAELPQPLIEAVRRTIGPLRSDRPLAVRSSSPGEDSSSTSFAGLHESFLDISDEDELFRSIRLVWASLWSDASLLYRKELGLDPGSSSMAVLIQEMIEEDCSGVSFSCDPRYPELPRTIIEAVAGRCCDLVDGTIDPQRWVLARPSGTILEWKKGGESSEELTEPLLSDDQLKHLFKVLLQVEDFLGWATDMEWTGRADDLVILQARPVSMVDKDQDEKRKWYLDLRLKLPELRNLAVQVSKTLIPELESLGNSLAGENLGMLSDSRLALTIDERLTHVRMWRQIYYDKFIPFAHGVRLLGLYYNTFVQPEDAFEFVDLLRGEEMLASRRNTELLRLASLLANSPPLMANVVSLADRWPEGCTRLKESREGAEFLSSFDALLETTMDVAYQGERIASHPLALLRIILEIAGKAPTLAERTSRCDRRTSSEERLYQAVGQVRRAEAEEILRLGRLSWRLRDDDNLLLGKVESQFLRALEIASERLKKQQRLHRGITVGESHAEILVNALKNPDAGDLLLDLENDGVASTSDLPVYETPRQLVGQPASAGFSRGVVRCVRSIEDLAGFCSGEVLVCDSIQPMMTQLVPLASAIIERRGGMLIHGAIIARELGIPCVNGVAQATELLKDGQSVCVDGDLGIVTVGPPEFSLEGIDRL